MDVALCRGPQKLDYRVGITIKLGGIDRPFVGDMLRLSATATVFPEHRCGFLVPEDGVFSQLSALVPSFPSHDSPLGPLDRHRVVFGRSLVLVELSASGGFFLRSRFVLGFYAFLT